MERLDLDMKPAHPLEEAAIHLARYANILNHIKDKTVLDLACGEGYGSALLMQYGAKKVVGVDISVETIEKAKQLFGSTGAEYIAGDAQTVAQLLGESVFDVVVSIETIEHVQDPEALLKTMKKVAKEDAIFYITCPNDYWYFPTENESNPFHIRKYTFEDFPKLTQSVLGNAVSWGLGSTVWGFGTAPLYSNEYQPLGTSWMRQYRSEGGLIIENDSTLPLDTSNCSFYCGIWNASNISFSSGVFPFGMDAYKKIFEAIEYDIISQLRDDNDALRNRVQELEVEFRRKTLFLMAADSENKILKESVSKLDLQKDILQQQIHKNARQAEEETFNLNKQIIELNNKVNDLSHNVDVMKIGYYRYLRMSKYVPVFAKKLVLKMYHKFHG
ncbi:methyltransferase domain-containing protein [Escherichia coli]|uniref:methyltransferase domain-containing protein n=1 Tax=Escherichia coli TaxID=562 RepID=UPI000B8026BC|nr:methyltransferase domain-containing protein [Escherichia coli]MBC0384767.1 methyltransferase domain-containing protein [Escherichia coli]